MSVGKSWNKLGRKRHRYERSQPKARRKLGFLEHHKDYKERADNYHQKQNQLNNLRLLASLRNPDEFHSNMVHTKALDGRLWLDRDAQLGKKRLKVYRDLDSKHITMGLQHQQNKLRRELNSFNCMDAANVEGDDKEGKHIVESSNDNLPFDLKSLLRKKENDTKRADHVIFVEDNNRRESFDASLYFSTPRDLLRQKHNRLRTSQMAKRQIAIDVKRASLLKKQALLKYWQLQGRIQKVDNMKKYKRHLDLKRKVQGSHQAHLVYKQRNIDSGKVVKRRYKWPQKRKR